MPYVDRDREGRITALRAHIDAAGGRELLPGDHPEVIAFLEAQDITAPPRAALDQSDAEMSRVLEDLVDLLIRKGLIEANELPNSARRKLIRRRDLRGAGKWLHAMIGEEKII